MLNTEVERESEIERDRKREKQYAHMEWAYDTSL